MSHFSAPCFTSKRLAFAVTAFLTLAPHPTLAADEPDQPKGAAVTVLKAAKACFGDIVEVSGTLIAREGATSDVRPERMGLKVTEILAEAGDIVAAGQNLARLTLPEGGLQVIQAPVAGQILVSSAVIGAMAGGKGEALFSILSRNEYDLVGLVPISSIAKLAVNQPARIRIPGAGELDARVRRVAPTVEAGAQLGQVFIGVTTNRRLLVNSSGRALIKTGQSCNIAVPLTSVLYGGGGTVVQVVRRGRVETRRVEVGLMSGGQVEISSGLQENDIVVARAGALLREGDPVRAVNADAK